MESKIIEEFWLKRTSKHLKTLFWFFQVTLNKQKLLKSLRLFEFEPLDPIYTSKVH